MDFSHFDTRRYPTVSAQEGYSLWASTYEDIVQDAMDIRLLNRLQTISWGQAREAADLACGTGRIGVWLKGQGVGTIDGLDLTPAMLEGARAKGVYRQLLLDNVLGTPLPSEAYDLVTISLADEHLPTVAPLYDEAARILRPNGHFVLVGFHPFFLMNGVPTHYTNAAGESVTIECYVHLLSDHVKAAFAAGLALREMHEGVIDEDWLAVKPKWQAHLNRPVSFVTVWQKQG
jgi:SAM-dependent methyltransferase